MAFKMKFRIWNDLFPNENLTCVPSENDTNTTVKDIVTLINLVIIH